MSHSPATRGPALRARPLSPHLTIYRWPITMTMSIMHRITGGALYVGAVLVVWWLIAVATSESQFGLIDWLVRSWFGKLVLLGYTWAMFHHMLGGLRHLIWDTGAGMDKAGASKLAWATIVGSVLLTLLVWAVYLAIA